jgi:hypothetical protein
MKDGFPEEKSGVISQRLIDPSPQIKVGIFWLVDDVIVSDAVNLDESEPYGEALQHGGHYEFWGNLNAANNTERKLKSHSYDYYPRGRVICFPKRITVTIYADSCLTPEALDRIIHLFSLEGRIVEVATDEHYCCSNCNRAYLE